MIVSTTILLLVPLVITTMLLSFFAINSLTTFFSRLVVIILMTAVLLISVVSFNMLLSKPKQIEFEWIHRNVEKVEILSAVIVNKKAIYVWIRFIGEAKPRYYVFTWNKELAEQIQKAMSSRRRGKRGKIIMDRPFDNSTIIGDVEFMPRQKQLPNKIYEK